MFRPDAFRCVGPSIFVYVITIFDIVSICYLVDGAMLSAK